MLHVLLLLLLVTTESVNITKCCEESVASIDLEYLSCRPTLPDQPPFPKIRPKIFSLQSETYVSQEVLVTSTGIPRCQAGQVLTSSSLLGDHDEEFVLLAEEKTLFIKKDSSTQSDFCVDDVQSSGVAIGSIALFCVPDPELVCSTKYCVSTCCPEEMMMDKMLGHCKYRQGYELQPPFVDKAYNPVTIMSRTDYVLLHGEPACNTHVYHGRSGAAAEFHLVDDGLLHIGHHVLNHTEYCLEEVDDGTGMLTITAKVPSTF